MDITEMKLRAIKHIIHLNKERSVMEILERLEKLNSNETKMLNLSLHYPVIKEQYDSVFAKLASD